MLPDPVPEHTWLTLDELAELLHIAQRHVRRLVAENRIPYTKVGARLRFRSVTRTGTVAAPVHPARPACSTSDVTADG